MTSTQLELDADPRRILVVRLSHLGDVVHALPLYHRLAERWPAAELAWAVQPEYASLVAGLPRIRHTIEFDRGGGLRAWMGVRRALADFAPDLAVDCQGNLKSAGVTWASRAPTRAGWHRRDWREPLGARSLTAQAPPSGAAHAVDRVDHLATWITGLAVPARLDPDLSSAERRAGDERLTDLIGTAPAPVVVQLSAPGDPRSWPLEPTVETLRALRERGRSVVVLAGPAEGDLARAVEAAAPREAGGLEHTTETGGARATAALLAAVAARDGRMVATDSGPCHLAAAVGLPTAVLSGPQDPQRTGPWPPPSVGAAPQHAPGRRSGDTGSRATPHRAVRAEPPVDCSPCLQRRCTLPEGPVCMGRIGAPQVLEALGET